MSQSRRLPRHCEEEAFEVARHGETVTHRTPDQIVVERLQEIEQLKPNWDGEGASAPDREVVCFARILWDEIRRGAQRSQIPLPVPGVAVFPNGVVALTWAKNRERFIELNVRGADDFEVCEVDGDREESEDTESIVAAAVAVLDGLTSL